MWLEYPQASFRGLLGRFRAHQKRLLQFSESIAGLVPQRFAKESQDDTPDGKRRRPVTPPSVLGSLG